MAAARVRHVNFSVPGYVRDREQQKNHQQSINMNDAIENQPANVTITTVKPGWKTTEFWLAKAAMILGALYAVDIIPSGGPWEKIAALACAVLASCGYSVSRGLAKSAALILAAAVLALTSGCISSTAIEHGYIQTTKIRQRGLHIGQQAGTGQPEIFFGMSDITIQDVPTSTNGPINSPNMVDLYQFDSSGNPFKVGSVENVGYGNVSVTNTAGRTIVPAPGVEVRSQKSEVRDQNQSPSTTNPAPDLSPPISALPMPRINPPARAVPALPAKPAMPATP